MSVRVVLIEPSHPGNIGAVARAMGNMGYSQLAMVRPVSHLVEEARVRSANNESILYRAEVCSSLKEAIGQCTFVVGTSARIRTVNWPSKSPRSAMLKVAELDKNNENVAILFGPERTGLSNHHLDLCDLLVRISTSDESPSINLAGSVLLLLYELRVASEQKIDPVQKKSNLDVAANRYQIEGFFEHLHEVMVEVEFIPNQPRAKLMRKIRRIFLRPGLTVEEINIFRGILTEVLKKVSAAKSKER